MSWSPIRAHHGLTECHPNLDLGSRTWIPTPGRSRLPESEPLGVVSLWGWRLLQVVTLNSAGRPDFLTE